MLRFAYDRNFFPALKAGVPYKIVGRGWGWVYVGPILIGRWRRDWLDLLLKRRRR